MKEEFAIAAAILAIAGNLPYLWDMWKGRVQPHPYTWLVWALVSGTVLFGQLAKGAGVGALPTAVSEFFTLAIFLFSLKFGFRGITKTDTIFLLCALLGIGLWFMTKDPTLSVVIAVCIDLVAFVPTLRKTWAQPKTETPILYSSNVLRHILALFALEAYNVATALHSISMIATNTLMVMIIFVRKRF